MVDITTLTESYRTLFNVAGVVSFETLRELESNALKTAYRQCAKMAHPDKARQLGLEAQHLAREFEHITRAYEILGLFLERKNEMLVTGFGRVVVTRISMLRAAPFPQVRRRRNFAYGGTLKR